MFVKKEYEYPEIDFIRYVTADIMDKSEEDEEPKEGGIEVIDF